MARKRFKPEEIVGKLRQVWDPAYRIEIATVKFKSMFQNVFDKVSNEAIPAARRDIIAIVKARHQGEEDITVATRRPRSNPNTSKERINKPSFEQLDRVNPYQKRNV